MNNEFQEINLGKLVMSVLRMWWLILIMVTVGAISAYIVTANYITPTYEARATLFIGKDTDVLSSISMSDLQIDNKLVLDYRELIRTKLVANQVIEDLNLNISYERMITRLGVDTISDSRFVGVTYVDTDAQRAAMVANRLSETLVIKAQDIVGVDNIQIVDYADAPKAPTSPSMLINVLMAMIIGFIISLVIIFILHKLDNRLKTKNDIEELTGLTVLSEIPKFRGR